MPVRTGHREIILPLPRTLSPRNDGLNFQMRPPSTTLKQYAYPSSDPTYTRSSKTVGAIRIGPPVNLDHLTSPVVASRQYTLLSAEEPKHTASPTETTWNASSKRSRAFSFSGSGQAGSGACRGTKTHSSDSGAPNLSDVTALRALSCLNVGQSSAAATKPNAPATARNMPARTALRMLNECPFKALSSYDILSDVAYAMPQ